MYYLFSPLVSFISLLVLFIYVSLFVSSVAISEIRGSFAMWSFSTSSSKASYLCLFKFLVMSDVYRNCKSRSWISFSELLKFSFYWTSIPSAGLKWYSELPGVVLFYYSISLISLYMLFALTGVENSASIIYWSIISFYMYSFQKNIF